MRVIFDWWNMCLNILPRTLHFLRRWTFPSCLFTLVWSLYWNEKLPITFSLYYRRGSRTPKNRLWWRIRGGFRNFRGPQRFSRLRRSFNSIRHKPHLYGEAATETKPAESLQPGRNQQETLPAGRSEDSGELYFSADRLAYLGGTSVKVRLFFYLLDISLRPQIIFPFTDFSFLLKTSRYDLLEKILLFQFNFRKRDKTVRSHTSYKAYYQSVRKPRWLKSSVSWCCLWWWSQ